MRNVNATDLKLKERVKELNCLYEMSKLAWEANNDIEALVSRALQIIPEAMQYPELAETEIKIGTERFSTSRFEKSKSTIEAKFSVDKKTYGSITIGYRSSGKSKHKLQFLPEERSLLKTVAHELSLFIK